MYSSSKSLQSLSKDELIAIIQLSAEKTKSFKEHEFLQTIIDSIPYPMMIINSDYSVSLMNKARRESIKGRIFLDNNSPKCYEISHYRNSPCTGDEHTCPLYKTLETKQPTKVIHNHKDMDGSDHFFELSATPIFDDVYNCIGIIESSVDITEHIKLRNALQQSNKDLTHLAHHDYLTGLPNRVLFMDRLEQTIKDSKREHIKSALFFMDLDHFKEINDNFGHDTGDAVLKEVCKRFLECIRENDTLSRLAGDEFTLIMKDVKNKNDIKKIASKVVTSINKPMNIDDQAIHISVSIGISIFPNDANNAEDILLLSDDAMYQAKAKGKNNFHFYN